MIDKYSEKQIFTEISNKWFLRNIVLPIEFNNNEIRAPIFEIMNDQLLKKHTLKELQLPNFSIPETVIIFSDYSGESSNSKYYTYTFLFVDYSTIGLFSKGMKAIREEYFHDSVDKEISFKDSGYGPINRCIDDFLRLSNNFMNGLVFTLIVEKSIISLIAENNKEGLKQLSKYFIENDLGVWKEHVLEKGLRVLYTVTFLCKLLIPSGKNIFWMSDNDSIVPNTIKAKNMMKVFKNCLDSLKQPPIYKNISYTIQPFDYKEDEYHFRDLLSITDIVAGSIEQYFTKSETMADVAVNNVANKTLKWLSGQGIGLKKLNLVIRERNKLITGSFVDFIANEPVPNTKSVDIIYDVHLETPNNEQN